MKIQSLLDDAKSSPVAYCSVVLVVGIFLWLYSCTGSDGAFSFDNRVVEEFASYNLFANWKNGGQWVESTVVNYEWLLLAILLLGLSFFLKMIIDARRFYFSIESLLVLIFASAIFVALISYELENFNEMMDWVRDLEARGGNVLLRQSHSTVAGPWYTRWPLAVGIFCSIFGVISFNVHCLRWLRNRVSAAESDQR